MLSQRVQGQIYHLFSHPTRLPVLREAVAKHNIDIRHQMLLNNTNILNCGVAHKGRRDRRIWRDLAEKVKTHKGL
jgi:hypothetical protein